MIKFTVSSNNRQAEIWAPCQERDIRRVQRTLQMPSETDTTVQIKRVDSDLRELSVLEGQEADLDFLNLLGRVMYGMDFHEYDQFRIGLYYEKPTTLKDIVNISQSVNRYSIVTDNLFQSGLDHAFDLRSGIPREEVENTDYTPIGQELLDSGKCEETPYGKLYVNEEIPVSDFFDGKHMPPYYDRTAQITGFLKNGAEEDFVFLPCSDSELQRSAKRLHASSPYGLVFEIDDFGLSGDKLLDKLVRGADICTLNKFAELLERFDEDETDKFSAVLSYVNSSVVRLNGLNDAVRIGGNLDAFSFYPNALSDEELGWSALSPYNVPDELLEYFDAERYGSERRLKESGQYTENGYVGVKNPAVLKNCLSQNQGMGGIV